MVVPVKGWGNGDNQQRKEEEKEEAAERERLKTEETEGLHELEKVRIRCQARSCE